MSFLAPLFLLGALAIAAPVIFHLIRRTTREKLPFSSLMFLQPTPPRLTKRSRLEHLLLLLLRALVLLFLAFGFARPFVAKPLSADNESGGMRRVVVLLDTSASMKRDGLWEQAVDRTLRVIRELSPADQAAVFAFDQDLTPLISAEQWQSVPGNERGTFAQRRLQNVKPTWRATHLDRALLAAVESLEEYDARDARERPGGLREIILISDLQEGSRLDRLQAFGWPDGITVRSEILRPLKPTNAGAQFLSDPLSEAAEGQSGARVRVSNSTSATHEQFQLGWVASDGSADSFIFLQDDLRDAPSFADKVKTGTNGVAAFIQSRLRDSTRQDLKSWQSPEQVGLPLKLALIEDLNTIIYGPLIWESGRFREAAIRNETKTLLDGKAAGASLVRLNRLLLEDAYPVELAKYRQGFIGQAVDVYVPPGQSRVFPLPKTPAGLPEERLRLAGDDDAFDNTAYLVPTLAQEVRLVYLGNDTATNTQGSLFYLQRAFPQTKQQLVTLRMHRLDEPVSRAEYEKAALIVVTGKLSEQQAADLRPELEAGQTVLLTLPNADAAIVLAKLAGVPGVRCEEAVVANYSLLGRVDFEHPLFQPFADPRYSDFAKIVFWKHRRLELADLPEAIVLAGFDDGAPALVQVPVGKGTLLILTAGWHPGDSQLALSTKFVPLMHSLLSFAGSIQERSQRLYVGDAIRFRSAWVNQPVRVRKPDGTQVDLAAGSTGFSGTDAPGIYSASAGQETQRYAVNLDPRESHTAPLQPEELERMHVPLKGEQPAVATTLATKQQLLNTELENKQKLWRWLVVAALIALLGETWLSGRLTQKPATV